MLENDNIKIAREKLSLAEKIFPKNETINVLRASINKRYKIKKINILKKEISSLTKAEKWQEVITKYKDILVLDNTNVFAVDGLNLAKEINELIKQINILNYTPLLLTKIENLDKAKFLYSYVFLFENIFRNYVLGIRTVLSKTFMYKHFKTHKESFSC